jgi:hypothetical protein
MSIFDPRQTGSGAEPDGEREQEDAPLPTRFGRDARRRMRPRPQSGAERATGEPRAAPDDEQPFEDDGGL